MNDHYERTHFDKGLKTIHPKTNRYKGKIYILTGPMTVSTATMFCKYLCLQRQMRYLHRMDTNPELDRIDAELAAVERMLRAGHLDIEGLVLALKDWRGERRLFLEERRTN